MKSYLLSLALLAMVGVSMEGFASVITVTSTADAGVGTLRNAVDSALAGDTVVVDASLSGALFSLATGQITIDKNLTIKGLGGSNTAVTANTLSRVFEVTAGVTAKISGWTLAQGSVTGNGGGILNAGTLQLNDIKILGCTASGDGAGIYSTGSATLSQTVVKSCIASGNGGGIYCDSANLSIFDTKIEDNEAVDGAGIYSNAVIDIATTLVGNNIASGSGGGIYATASANVIISKSSFTNNTSAGNGGGVYSDGSNLTIARSTFNDNSTSAAGGAVFAPAGATFQSQNSTYSANSAVTTGGAVHAADKFLSRGNTYTLNDAGTDGGAIFLTVVSALRIHEGNIVYGNTVGGATADDIANPSTLFSSKYNIYGVIDDGGFSAGTGDQIGVDPMLGPLADNGGESFTHAISCGSAAINAGNPASPLTNDQRSLTRPYDGGFDIGSFELQDSCNLMCSIDSVTIGTQGACDPGTDTYTQDVTVYYTDGSGDLDVNGQVSTATGSPQTVTLTGLASDSGAVDLNVAFTGDTLCVFNATAAWTAPASCFVAPVCSIDSVTIGTQGACDPGTDTYTQDVTVYYTDGSGDLDVNGQVSTATGSPQTVTLTGLASDSGAVDLNVAFTGDTLCVFNTTAAWTAPASCFVAPVCSIDSVTIGTQGACDPGTDTYTQDVTVYYTDGSGDLDVNGQVSTATGSPQTVTLTGLASDSGAVDLNVAFTGDTLCVFNTTAAWTAPASCFVPPCSIDSVTVGVQGACDPGTDTYTQDVTVYYTSGSGDLDVNGQVSTATGSPQTVTLTGLVSDSNAVDLNVAFTGDTLCVFNATAAWTAPASCFVAPVCSIDSVTIGTQGACDPGTDTYTQDVTVYYTDGSGDLDVNGQVSTATGSPQTVTLTGLASDSGAVDLNVAFTGDTLCVFNTTAAWTAPASCFVPPCSIDSVTVGVQGACDPGTDTYTQDVTVYYTSGSGDLDVNGQVSTATGSPQTVTLTGLASDSGAVDLNVAFTGDTLCVFNATAAWTAPASCFVAPVCSIDSVTIGTQGACDPGTDTYTQDVTVYYTDGSGDLDVNGQVSTATGSPQTVTLTGLASDSGAVDLNVAFTGDTLCVFNTTAAWTAPASCFVPPCSIDSVTVGVQGACDPGTDTYTQDVTVYYSNAPGTGSLDINGQTFAISGSPQTETLTGLTSDGGSVDLTASFTDDAGCTLTNLAAWTAPASCFVGGSCSIDGIAIGTQTPCNSGTNKYEQVITVTYTNPPVTGSLDINGNLFAISGSPQTLTLTGLFADAKPVTLNASFTDDAGCSLTVDSAFTAAAACIVCFDVTPGGQTSTQLGSGAYRLEWDSVPTSLACRLNGRPLGSPGFALVTVNGGGSAPTSAVIGASALSNGTTYEWKVKCACELPSPAPSNVTKFSPLVTFTYFDVRLENPDLENSSDIQVYPNPAEAGIYLTAPVLPEGDVVVEVIDMDGRVHYTSSFEASGYATQVYIDEVAQLPAGNYIVNMRHSEGTFQVNFVKVD